MIDKDFLSEENSTVLYKVIKKHVQDRSEDDIANYGSLNIENRLRGVMLKMYKTTDLLTLQGNREQQLIQLNKRVVRACVPGFLNMIEVAKNNPNFKMNRLDKRPVATDNYRQTDGLGGVSNENKLVNQRFEEVNQERNMSNGRDTKPKTIDFSDDNINDKAKYEDPTRLFEMMEKKRQEEAKQLLKEREEDESVVNNSEISNNSINSNDISSNNSNNSNNRNITRQDLENSDINIKNTTNIHPSLIKEAKVVEPISAEPYNVKSFSENREKEGDGLQEDFLDGLDKFSEGQNNFKNKEEAFQARLKRLQDVREDSFRRNLLTSNEIKEDTNLNNNNNNFQPRVVSKTNDLSKNSIFEERNRIDSLTRNNRNIYDVEPKSLLENELSQPLKLQSDNNINNINPVKATRMSYPIIQPPKRKEYLHNDYILVINAYDRKWYGEWSKDEEGADILTQSMNTNRYNFTLKFSPSVGENNMASIKRNFKNVTGIEVIDIILSAHDNPTYIGDSIEKDSINKNNNYKLREEDYFGNGELDEDEGDYDDSDGELIDLDLVAMDADNCNNTNKVDISLKEQILPYANLNLQNYPYLLFNITEYTGDVYSTNTTNKNSTSRLVIAKHFFQGRSEVLRPNMSGFLLLRPSLPKNCSCLEFRPTPISSLDTLTFQINTPDGLLYASENTWNLDNLNIQKIVISLDTGFPKIHLHINKLFLPSIYEIGDNIIIKSLEFLELVDGKNYIIKDLNTLAQKIKKYLEEPTGCHIVARHYTDYNNLPIVISNTDKFGFCNIISVPLPLDILQDYYDKLDNKVWEVGGCLLNKSIQPVITLKITSRSNELITDDLVI